MREKRRREGIKGKEKERRKEKRKKERKNEGKKRKKERKEKKEEGKGDGRSCCRRRPEVAGDGRKWPEMGGQSPKPNQWWCKCS